MSARANSDILKAFTIYNFRLQNLISKMNPVRSSIMFSKDHGNTRNLQPSRLIMSPTGWNELLLNTIPKPLQARALGHGSWSPPPDLASQGSSQLLSKQQKWVLVLSSCLLCKEKHCQETLSLSTMAVWYREPIRIESANPTHTHRASCCPLSPNLQPGGLNLFLLDSSSYQVHPREGAESSGDERGWARVHNFVFTKY